MILVDTSVWIDHLARGDARLQTLLEDGEVLTHPYVIGEIALGSLPRRQETLSALQALPAIDVASADEAMAFLHGEQLFGMGIGYVDLHLLAATRLETAARLWTRDKRLLQAAVRLKLAAFDTH
ncbi:type II toxin-antitoxin system VapC family toxin [Variovorax ginsengisoli]|jgi:predicted nucleic acid-binding protein|uniref:Ribonuclease VapC n=1 Tax=Variovorax ginsengisoli TaxID=363844 RepID=A0ABT8SCM6_9BURK|nr:type II toxin-antitoxin system VapC family toxin [Variovorax ginsengisoli]MDN8617023.1 type II toxin-antitoxin system VapC family toxin [Variovorax ginsengisoli]MDO1536193.1 type II toxin-antitoxin system VapC family toxin [Variovorax ginsengisoli]